MRKNIRAAFNCEMEKGMQLYADNKLEASFIHLERAHILGQKYIWPHVISHWWMLKIGYKHRSFREVFGQTTRIIASILFSRIWVPLGNTGGTNISAFKRMTIPEDLKKILDEK